MGSRYSPATAMGVPARDYESYWDDPIMPDYESREPIDFTPQFVGGDTNPMLLSQYNPVSERADDVRHKQFTGSIDAQNDIQSGDTNWASPDGLSKLQSFVARGVIAPQQARAIMSTIPAAPKYHAPSKYDQPPDDVALATTMLRMINPNSPDAFDQLKQVVDPRVTHPRTQAHPAFAAEHSAIQRSISSATIRREAAGLHAPQVSPDEKLIGEALKAGVTPEELDPYLDENGKVANRIGIQAAMHQSIINDKVLGTGAGKRLEEFGYNASRRPSDSEKEEWLKSNGIDPLQATSQQWNSAWHGVKAQNTQAYNDYLQFLGSQGYRKLPGGKAGAIPSPAGGGAGVAPQSGGLPPVATGQPTQPNQKQIARLVEDPALRPQFDEKFGPGAAAKILGY